QWRAWSRHGLARGKSRAQSGALHRRKWSCDGPCGPVYGEGSPRASPPHLGKPPRPGIISKKDLIYKQALANISPAKPTGALRFGPGGGFVERFVLPQGALNIM